MSAARPAVPEVGKPKRSTPRPSAVLYLGPAALYVGYIFVMGTARDVGPPLQVSDKTAHFVAFGLMVPLLLRALLYFAPRAQRGRLVWAAAGLSSLAGAFLEFWQSFLPYRSAELLDWVADTIGATLAAVLVALFFRFFGATANDGPSGSSVG